MAEAARLGRRVDGVTSFSCAQCGQPAATIEVILGDEPIRVGPGPMGEDMAFSIGSPTGTVSLAWLGTSLRQARPEVTALLDDSSGVDPLALARLDWELGAFCCRQCEQNYCASCWRTWPVFADDYPGWHEETRGRCPQDHEQRLDD